MDQFEVTHPPLIERRVVRPDAIFLERTLTDHLNNFQTCRTKIDALLTSGRDLESRALNEELDPLADGKAAIIQDIIQCLADLLLAGLPLPQDSRLDEEWKNQARASVYS